MANLQRCSVSLFKRRSLLTSVRAYNLASSNHPATFTSDDIGKLYKVDQNAIEILNLHANLHKPYVQLLKTWNECVWLCREPFMETINYFKLVSPTLPAFRVVLWGPFGTGKTITLNQAIHCGHEEGFVIVHVPSAMRWNVVVRPTQVSSYKPDRIDVPEFAVDLLQNFKKQNQPLWSKLAELKTERDYNWSKVEKTQAGRPLTDIVEMGISAPFSSTDCVGALFKELRRHSSEGSIKLLVGIDYANSLYGKTTIKKANFQKATTDELTLALQTRKFFKSDWTNGICVIVTDKCEISDTRDKLSIPLITPLETFGEQGFDDIDPFIPVETKNYTKEEADTIYDYLKEINWLTKAKVPEAKKQLFYLSF